MTQLTNLFQVTDADVRTYLKVPREHRANQEAEQRRAEQGGVLELEQVGQEQRAEVHLQNVSHLSGKTQRDKRRRRKQTGEKKQARG